MVSIKDSGGDDFGTKWDIISDKPLHCILCKNKVAPGELIYYCMACKRVIHRGCCFDSRGEDIGGLCFHPLYKEFEHYLGRAKYK